MAKFKKRGGLDVSGSDVLWLLVFAAVIIALGMGRQKWSGLIDAVVANFNKAKAAASATQTGQQAKVPPTR